MSSLEEEDKILATASHTIDGRHCEVRIPEEKAAEAIPSGKRVAPRRSDKIFVGRITQKLTEETLREFFDKEVLKLLWRICIRVTSVVIPQPFRSFAFVTFTHSEVAERLIRYVFVS
ncbi:hypothetical protein COOONC_15777 [Cooperia oncophora]